MTNLDTVFISRPILLHLSVPMRHPFRGSIHGKTGRHRDAAVYRLMFAPQPLITGRTKASNSSQCRMGRACERGSLVVALLVFITEGRRLATPVIAAFQLSHLGIITILTIRNSPR